MCTTLMREGRKLIHPKIYGEEKETWQSPEQLKICIYEKLLYQVQKINTLSVREKKYSFFFYLTAYCTFDLGPTKELPYGNFAVLLHITDNILLRVTNEYDYM